LEIPGRNIRESLFAPNTRAVIDCEAIFHGETPGTASPTLTSALTAGVWTGRSVGNLDTLVGRLRELHTRLKFIPFGLLIGIALLNGVDSLPRRR
jgi:hypothetical protein